MKKFYQDSWITFNNSAIKVLLGTIILLVCLSTTMAWFTDSDHTTNESDTGNIYVTLSTNLKEIKMVAPNKTVNFQDMILVQGKPTTADSYIRILFQANIGSDDVTKYFSPLLYRKTEHTLNGDKSWIYNTKDKKYYFVGFTNENTPVTFCNGVYVSQYLPKAYADKTVIFTVKVEAIQRKYKAYETEPGWQENYSTEWSSLLTKYDLEIDSDTEIVPPAIN